MKIRTWHILTLMFISAQMRSFSEIAKWRKTWSWVPQWYFDYRGPFDIDFYHFASNLHWMIMFTVGILFCLSHNRYHLRNPYMIAIVYFLVWLIHGFFNNLWYHFLWMKPEFWGIF